MRNKKLYLVVALLIVAAVTGVSFAQTATTSTVTIAAGGTSTDKGIAEVTTATAYVATQALKYGTVGNNTTQTTLGDPNWSPIVGSAGSITAGDVYYIDSTHSADTGYTNDILVTLYLENPGELAKNYTYLNMKVNVWVLSGSSWAQATLATASGGSTTIASGAATPATGTYRYWLTLSSGFVSFILADDAKYTIAVDGGSFYCTDTTTTSGSDELSPSFYIEVRQA